MTAEQQQAVVRAAESWMGTPFHHMARIKGAGVDCAQLLIAVYSEARLLEAYDPGYYTPDWYMHQGREIYLDHIKQHADAVAGDTPADWEIGDILTYRRKWKCTGHAGIYVGTDNDGDGMIIHALQPAGKVSKDKTCSPYLRRWFSGAWRIRIGATA